jgi:hypothetical protein
VTNTSYTVDLADITFISVVPLYNSSTTDVRFSYRMSEGTIGSDTSSSNSTSSFSILGLSQAVSIVVIVVLVIVGVILLCTLGFIIKKCIQARMKALRKMNKVRDKGHRDLTDDGDSQRTTRQINDTRNKS